jgi:pimeloyl-ACP methyl ester carboxylesterase
LLFCCVSLRLVLEWLVEWIVCAIILLECGQMPYVEVHDALLHYRKYGHGVPLLLLHAGWGLAINNFAYQESVLVDRFTLVVPDRRGYGRSSCVESLEADFHWQAADDMFALLDALNISEVRLWGHSDGAVIGAIMAILQPTRALGLIFEGGHFYSRKPRSRAIFEQLCDNPMLLPEPARRKLAEYHGQNAWQRVIRNWAGAWLELAKCKGDLYRGRLNEIACPTLMILGEQDEHTPVIEIEKMMQYIRDACLSVYPEGGHCVHDGRLTQERCTREIGAFLSAVHSVKHG